MPTQKQRREAARRHLERQLQARQAREARRKQVTLIVSIVTTLAIIGAVIVVIALNSGDTKKTPAASNNLGSTPTASNTASNATTPATACDNSHPTKMASRPAKGAPVSFMGVTVRGATDLAGKPVVTAHNTKPATKLAVKDLVVGKGKAANPKSCVTIQYDGVLFTNGKEFDSSWSRGETAQFSLTGVVPGFTQGIGGTTGVTPMKEGGRRIIIVPAELGYGAQAQGSIPANSTLVFVVDLKSVDS